MSFSSVARAGQGVWTSGGPYAGGVRALAINPANPTTLYAAYGGRGGGVFKSTDSGGTWAAINTGLNPDVRALAINPAAPSTLYAGTDYGVFKSTDSGGTWAVVNTGLPSFPLVHALAINPANPATLYAGIYYHGVFKSTDSGTTWAAANTGLTSLEIGALAIDPMTPSTLYAVPDYGGGIFKSTDSGDTWAAANAGLTNFGVSALAINPSTPTTLYAATAGGVFKSTNSGGTWAAAGLANQSVSALAIDPLASTTLYAGAGDGVFKSTDSGGTWAAANAGLTNRRVSALAINPLTPTTLYAGAGYGGGAFKSTDSGGTWATAGLPDADVLRLAIDPANPATLYAVVRVGGIFKSTDSGGTWAAANTGLPGPSVGAYALAISPSTPDTLYAGVDTYSYPGGSKYTVFKSTNAGGTWTAAGPINFGVRALAVDPSTPATLYAGTLGGVFKSTDSGATWAAANTGLTNLYVFVLAINPATPATLYAGTEGGGLFKSTDSGVSWTAANTGLTNLHVEALAMNPTTPTVLYAGTGGGGVYKSTDSGSTWAAVNAGLPYLSVQALALDPTGATTLYAGAGGVWQSTPPTSITNALLPASAHSSGANGAFYSTSVSIADTGSLATSFTLKFLGNNQDGSGGPEQTFSLDPGKTTTFFDVLGSVFNLTSGFGAIHISSNSSTLNIVSVTSTPGFGGTFGQTLPAVSSSDLIPAGSARSILYIREGDGFRSNLILASNASVVTIVDVALLSPAGATLAAKKYWVPPNGMTQINRVVRDMGVSGPITGARLVLFSSTPGAAFTGVGSVIDETTNDPTAVLAQPASISGSAPYIWLLPSCAHSSGANSAFYTTNVAVSNVGAAPASFTMKFLGNNQDGSGGPEQTFNLEAGKSVTYFGVLGSIFSQTSAFGAIRITSNSTSLNIVSVTSTPGFGGTFGQAIPAVSSSNLIPAGSARSILYIREGDGFRTNLILASNANVSTTVDAVLVSPAGPTLATKSYSVPPNGMTQVNSVVRDMGVSGPITGARLVLSSSTSNAAFTAFASVIDEITNDPTAVEAK